MEDSGSLMALFRRFLGAPRCPRAQRLVFFESRIGSPKPAVTETFHLCLISELYQPSHSFDSTVTNDDGNMGNTEERLFSHFFILINFEKWK